MTSNGVVLVLGGLGLFLLGMTFMTEGLKAFAGPSLRELAERATRTRLAAVLTGTVFTAIVQSSGATTLAAIGMVNGGLLTLEQTLGVIYGANIGTTVTGWMVSLIGFKVNTSAFALPFVGVGAMLKLFTRGRPSSLGETIAGFGLLFYGISLMQAGLESAESLTTFEAQVSSTTFTGRLYLVGIGLVMTTIMQSSSAALTITLAALSTGVLHLADGAALAIGQNVGSTTTALIASMGVSTTNAKRAAVAHLLFNIVTGTIAVILFSPLLDGLVALSRLLGIEDAPSMLSAFHTAFNVIGVCLMTPLLGHTAHLLLRFIPDKKEQQYAPRFLDKNALAVPAAALDAVELELEHLKEVVLKCVERCARDPRRYRATKEETRQTKEIYRSTRELAGHIARFLEQVGRSPGLSERIFGFVRVIVHLRTAAAESYKSQKDRAHDQPEIHVLEEVKDVEAIVDEAVALLRKPEGNLAERDGALAELEKRMQARRKIARTAIFRAASEQRLSSDAGLELAEYVNHLSRVVHELYRATHAWASSSRNLAEGPMATEIPLSGEGDADGEPMFTTLDASFNRDPEVELSDEHEIPLLD